MAISAAVLGCFMSMFSLSAPASADANYRFERMWPVLRQEWYFYRPSDVTTDGNGYIYVADSGNHRIQKFTSDGKFVTRWGKEGQGNGEFKDPRGIAADSRGFLFVTDRKNHRVQKFTGDGEFVIQWGKEGNRDGDFDYPFGIALDHSGSVYVVDKNNHRIQKFTSDGVFITTWGEKGDKAGQFNYPEAIAADNSGFLYVADWNNHRIQKFTDHGGFVTQWGSEDGESQDPDGITVDKDGFVYVADSFNHQLQKFTAHGEFVDKWGSQGSGDGEFRKPYGITADTRGYIYVADRDNSRIQKFVSDGTFMMTWGAGNKEGELNWPKDMAIDTDGFVYVVDTLNSRIQKFAPDGSFAAKWGNKGDAPGQFAYPYGIAIDKTGHIYVTDMVNRRVQKFTDSGEFVIQWGNDEREHGKLNLPYAIATDTDNHIYVTDLGDRCVQKFTAQGEFVAQWGSKGTKEGQFESPYGITVDSGGSVYVVDAVNHSVQKFTSDGKLLAKWGEEGTGEGELHQPYSITIDHNNHIYIADAGNSRIQKFTPEGHFLTQWGQKGSNPGQMHYPSAIAVHPDTSIYVADTDNHRIQVFRETPRPQHLSKAIIAAGGGPFPGNRLWDATLSCANFAYRVLIHLGFTKEMIHYLADADMDMDNNGEPDDVDAGTTHDTLRDTITGWAKEPVPDTLVIYLVDHGGDGIFRMNETETLSVSDLDAWLDSLQTETSAKVILIYDACRSGSFLPELAPPEGRERIIITSTSSDENAYFITQGSISFSNYFWTETFNGEPLEKAFEGANAAMGETPGFQMALLEAHNTLIQDVHIGDAPDIQEDIPVILQAGHEGGKLYADVEKHDGIARVWAVIILSSALNQILPEKTVLELPGFDLMPTGEPGRYAGDILRLNMMGADHIAVYARDRNGNTSSPKLVNVRTEHLRKRKAVIAAGWAGSDDMETAIGTNANLAHTALTYQGYTDENICFLSAGDSEHGDGKLTSDALESVIRDSASEDTWDLTLYLVGKGEKGEFRMNETETLTPADLDKWLDSLQIRLPGTVTVIYDADHSGSFLPLLRPSDDKTRILISGSSAEERAIFLSGGLISFSGFFWSEIGNGENVRDAFLNAGKALNSYSEGPPTPQLDDNGNGIANEETDGRIAMTHTLGMGIKLAPFAGHVEVIVTDALSGDPVEHAVVRTDMGGVSGNMPGGSYRIAQLPGTVTLTVSAPGYEAATRENVPIVEGETTTENVALRPVYHSADYHPQDCQISLSELLRVIQLYNSGSYHCASDMEDGYASKQGDTSCKPHDSDYYPQDWRISLGELLRLIQFFNASGYHADESGEDRFAPEKFVVPPLGGARPPEGGTTNWG